MRMDYEHLNCLKDRGYCHRSYLRVTHGCVSSSSSPILSSRLVFKPKRDLTLMSYLVLRIRTTSLTSILCSQTDTLHLTDVWSRWLCLPVHSVRVTFHWSRRAANEYSKCWMRIKYGLLLQACLVISSLLFACSSSSENTLPTYSFSFLFERIKCNQLWKNFVNTAMKTIGRTMKLLIYGQISYLNVICHRSVMRNG